MKVRFLLDENLSPRLKVALQRLNPAIDILRVGDPNAPPLEAPQDTDQSNKPGIVPGLGGYGVCRMARQAGLDSVLMIGHWRPHCPTSSPRIGRALLDIGGRILQRLQ